MYKTLVSLPLFVASAMAKGRRPSGGGGGGGGGNVGGVVDVSFFAYLKTLKFY
jgi:hypothetical protein